MKFLLELLSCCGHPSHPSTSTSPFPAEEETWSLFPLPPSRTEDISRHRRRKRGRSGMSRSGSVCEWRPSLCAISEDNIVPAAVSETERILKRKVAPTSRAHVQSHRDDCRRAHLPTIIPAFSPTPFLF